MNLVLYVAYIPAFWLMLIIVSDTISGLWERRKLTLNSKLITHLSPTPRPAIGRGLVGR